MAPEAVGVEGGDLAGDTDAVDSDLLRPRVAGQLSCEIAGEVCAVGGVAGDGDDAQFLPVQHPDLVTLRADGAKQWIRRRLIFRLGSQVSELDAGGHPPTAPVVGRLPSSRKVR